MSTIIVDVEYPNGDLDCTVRAAVNGDDIRFLSTKGSEISYPAEADTPGWEKVIFVQVAPWLRTAESYDLPYITGVTACPPSSVDHALQHMLRLGAVIPVRPITSHRGWTLF